MGKAPWGTAAGGDRSVWVVPKKQIVSSKRDYTLFIYGTIIYELFLAGSPDSLRWWGDVFAAWWSMWSAARRAGEGELRTCWGVERREQWENPLLINITCSCQKEAVFSAVLDGFMCWFLCVLLTTALQGCIWQKAAQEVRALPWALPSLALIRTSLLTTSLLLQNRFSLGRVIPRTLSLGNG